jgi:hypothetical protein
MPAAARPEERSWPRRIGWMVVIWAASVVGLGIIAALLRGLMGLAGFTGQRIDALSPQISSSMSRPLGIVPISRKEVSHESNV